MLDFDLYRVLSFDCYGTLINWEAGILSALKPMFSNRGIEVSDDELLEAYGEIEAQLESGPWKAYRQVLRECVAGLGLRFDFPPTASEMDALPSSLGFWPAFPDTVEALRRLKSRYQLVIISNTDDDLFASTAKNLGVAFDHVITAEQCRSYKPSHNNFLRALERAKVPCEQLLHVAQSIYHDVVPTRALGISSVWVNRRKGLLGSGATLPAEGRPDLEVTDLKSLADLLLETARIQ
ncbi:MAG: haloacid dehalogenase type II [Acidobacteriaceae bacterium]